MAVTRGQLMDKIVEQAQTSPTYLDHLMRDPRGLMSRQLGTAIPDSLHIKVVQETADTYFVVLPYRSSEGEELSDSDLERVAGGMLDKTCEKSTLSTVVNLG